MLEDILAFAALPLAAAVIFTGIHTWLGLQVLRRNVVFADLALAQVSALGATVAVVAGHADFEPGRLCLHADLCRGCGPLADREPQPRPQRAAGSLHRRALCRRHRRDRACRRPFPQGAEHVKKMLVGGILSVTADDIVNFAVLYAAIGVFHWFIRRPCWRRRMLPAPRRRRGAGHRLLGSRLLSFVRRGRHIFGRRGRCPAGVLLSHRSGADRNIVLCPYRHCAGDRLGGRYHCESAGIFGSFLLDAPTGATTVLAFAVVLLLAGGLRAFSPRPPSAGAIGGPGCVRAACSCARC